MTINQIFIHAKEKNASDVHLIVNLPPTLRIDGQLIYIENTDPLTNEDIRAYIKSMISASDMDKFMAFKEFDFSFETEDKTRYRVNIHFEKNNFGIAARIISNVIPNMESTMMPQIAYNLLNLNQGLILVTGPTGCGKSTSLAAMVDYINNHRRCHIITLEDPIEYLFEPKTSIIIQRQLGSDMLSFSEGLKHVLRQDPDVVMVGEMRDLDTIATTITLAETGHLVLATLHTYSAAQTIDRIVDIFPPHQQTQIRMQLSLTLAGVISQRLLNKVGGTGRIAAREILVNNSAVSNMIRENKVAQIKTAIETGAKDGMMTLDQDIRRLYKEKLISKEDAQNNMVSPETLEKYK